MFHILFENFYSATAVEYVTTVLLLVNTTIVNSHAASSVFFFITGTAATVTTATNHYQQANEQVVLVCVLLMLDGYCLQQSDIAFVLGTLCSSIHDHTDSHCFMKLLQGQLKETLFQWPEQESHGDMVQKSQRILVENQCAYINGKHFCNVLVVCLTYAKLNRNGSVKCIELLRFPCPRSLGLRPI